MWNVLQTNLSSKFSREMWKTNILVHVYNATEFLSSLNA